MINKIKAALKTAKTALALAAAIAVSILFSRHKMLKKILKSQEEELNNFNNAINIANEEQQQANERKNEVNSENITDKLNNRTK